MTARVDGARVLHVTTTDISLDLLLGPQLSAFRDAGMDVHTASAPGPHIEPLVDRGVTHHPLHRSTRAMSVSADIGAVRELAEVIRRIRPDIIHLHNPKPGVYGRILGRVMRVPVVVNTVHGLYAQPTDRLGRRTVVYSLERIAAAFSHGELLQNPEDAAVLRRLRVPSDRVHLLGNGVDLERFRPPTASELISDRAALRNQIGASEDDYLVLAVGRLVAEKGYRELLGAMQLMPQGPGLTPVKLVVIGPTEPDKEDGIDSATIESAEASGVRFIGFSAEVERWYRAVDAYVLASHREGFPRSAMEAAATGLPVIATDIRGCRQVVEPEVTGLLVPVRSPRALAAALGRAAQNPDLGRRWGQAGRAKAVREFDQRSQVRITLDLYDRLLNEHR